jgi:hypothetical protein
LALPQHVFLSAVNHKVTAGMQSDKTFGIYEVQSKRNVSLFCVLKFLSYGNNHCHTEVLERSHLFSGNCTILPNRWPTTVDYEMAGINMFLKQ